MLEIVTKVIVYLALLILVLPLLQWILQVFQQTRYDIRRYYLWWKENLFSLFPHFLLSAILFLVLNLIMPGNFDIRIKRVLFTALLLVVTFIWWAWLKKHQTIKPLVYTFRVWRQTLVFLFLDLVLIFILSRLGNLLTLAAVFLPPANFCLMFVVAGITQPFEKLVHQSFVNKAKKILKTYPDLIKIAITGSYGKTSTKNIINEVLSQKYYSLMTPASFNTPLGIVRTVREHLQPLHQVFVCEMGADRVGEISYMMDFVQPQIAIVTSIGPQHLATFKTQENIIFEKMQLVEKLQESGKAILNYDNEYIRNYPLKNNCQIISYACENKAVDFLATDIKYSRDGSSFKVLNGGKSWAFKTKLLGQHNILNILAAIALARQLDVSWPQIQAAVAKTPQVAHRLQSVSYFRHTMIDDSFNSNPQGAKSALAVLKMMEKPRVLISCGMIDLGDKQDELNYRFGQEIIGCADIVILVGEKQTQKIYEALIDTGFPVSAISRVKTTREALALIDELGKNRSLTFLIENDLPDAYNR